MPRTPLPEPVRADEIEPGLDAAIAEAEAVLAEAVHLPNGATFDEVVDRIDHAYRIVGRAYGRFAAPRRFHHDPSVREAAGVASERVDRWTHGLADRADLAAVVERVARDRGGLDPEQRAWIAHWELDRRESGGGLSPADQRRLAELRDQLLTAPSRYFPALWAPVTLRIQAAEIDGVPAAIVAGFGSLDTAGGWTVTLSDPIVNAIQESAADRGLRERVARAWLHRGQPETTRIVAELAAARREIAALLGAASWTELRSARLAAGGPRAVARFLAEVEPVLTARAATELETMRAELVADTGDPDAVVEQWDWRYLEARLGAALGADAEAIREHLPLDAVLDGLARLSDTVFGVRLEPRPERPTWDADVRAVDLVDRDSGRLLGELFIDPLARDGKDGSAWMDALDPGDPGRIGEPRPPAFILAASAPPVAGGRPPTLSLLEVDQLFHEYGHVLDFALDRSRYAIVREDWIPFDWVEAPSLFLGLWASQDARVLATFARHVDTGAPPPPELFAALERRTRLNAAFRALRYLAMARVDQLLHGPQPIPIEEADREAWAVQGIPYVEGGTFVGSFLHLVGGYDAAAYGFLWDQALRDDIGTVFAADPTSPDAGAAYREHVLEVPWTEDPLDGLRRLLGRDWSVAAFLARIERG
ncbi:MAG TPA: M3 family metallopeptidase [Candidatus Limnocylindrales bacterium]|nr:M3 family metallopeptidase [Candidatus Limnocylindrales bacterium]